MSTELLNSSVFDTMDNNSLTTSNDTILNETLTDVTNVSTTITTTIGTTITTAITTIATTLRPTDTTTAPVKPRIGLMDIANNSLSRQIFAQLPGGRKRLSDTGEDDNSCPLLKNVETLPFLFPGWEGIPSNILILLIVFSQLIRKVYKTERLTKREYISSENSSDWIHFIYGKRGSNHTLFTSRRLNSEDPLAYLPLILHKHLKMKLLRGTDKDIHHILPKEPKTLRNESLNDTKTQQKSDLNASKPNSETKRTASESITEMTEDEQQQIADLRSILWDEDSAHNLSASTMGQRSEPGKGEPIKPLSLSKWISKYFLIADKDIFDKKGYDAFQYVVFQRYLIYFLGSLTVICMMIILPVNIYGGKMNDIPQKYYKMTTILNIKSASPLIYVHALMTIFVVAMGIFLMQSFGRLIGKSVKNVDKRTLLIENIPELKRNYKELESFLKQKFPNIVIKKTSFVYDVNKLTQLMMQLWTSIEAKNHCLLYQRKYETRCEVRPYTLGNLRGVCGCCKCSPKVNGIQYYIKEKQDLEKSIELEFDKIIRNPQQLAFVVFEKKEMAERKHCYCYNISFLFKWMFGHESDPFDSWQWRVSYAPYPDDINWPDISTSKTKETLINWSMNLIIVIIFMFISTPTSALNILKWLTGFKKFEETKKVIDEFDPIMTTFWLYIPTLGYTLMTSLLPALIKILTTAMNFRTKSEYNHSIMYKSFIFLLLMVLILPSLQIVTVYALFENKVQNENVTKEIELSCLFPTENGIFFLTYVLTSALVGNVIEMIRFAELAAYTIAILFTSRTTAEYLTARQNTKFEFYFGTYYPRILLLFTLIVTFSISCPLIAPIGLFYMIFKHLTDRYLIYHVYVPTKINQRIHSKAIVYIYVSLLFLLMQMYSHLDSMDFRTPSYIVGLALILHFLFTAFEFIYDLIFS